jgi:HSP20 family molecular chaperone IbpA
METQDTRKRSWMRIIVLVLAAFVAVEGAFLYRIHRRLENRDFQQVAVQGGTHAGIAAAGSEPQPMKAAAEENTTVTAATEPAYWTFDDSLADLWLLQHVVDETLPLTRAVFYVPPRANPAVWSKAPAASAAAEPRIKDAQDRYVITMNLPGLDRSDIQTRIQGDTLTVSGMQKNIVEKKQGDRVVASERITRRFEDSLTLPAPVKSDQMQVSYDHNVLTISVPKA